MSRPELCEQNAKFFPEDSQWARHCARVAAYLNAQKPAGEVR